MKSLIHNIYSIAKAYPSRNAIFIDGEFYTYSKLVALVAGIKSLIIKSGYGNEKLIGILTNDDIYTYASILAVLANGSGYVPINSKNPSKRNLVVIQDTGLKLILSTELNHLLEEEITKSEVKVEIICTGEVKSKRNELQIANIDRDDIAYLMFTSGSTGKPKGIPIYHRNLTSFLSIMLDKNQYDFSEQDRFLQMFELTFDLSVCTIFTPLCLGACVYVVPRSGVMYLNIAKMLDEQKITVALMVPSVLSYMERFFSELKLDSMRYSIFCGEALLQDLCEGWSRCIPNAHIQNTYGPTEATVMCLYYDWFIQQSRTDSVNGIVPIGKSMPGINIVVLDDDLVPVASGNKGELCLCGEQVTDRYWNDIDKTQTSFIEISYLDVKQKFYRTGDMCYLNKDGNYIFCGRKDFQIKIDGHRIELEEIEQVAREFTGDNLAAVVPVEDIQGGVSLTLYIKKLDIEPVELQSYMSTRLPGYMLPKKVIMLEEIPLNTNGKVDRKVLSKL